MNTKLKQVKHEIFEYLFDLRASGAINMWSAPAYLQERFALTRQESREYFFDWMDFKHAQDRLKETE